MTKCQRCQGDGYYWRVPDGFNPFLAGGFQTAAVSEKIKCWACRGTGIAVQAPAK